MVDVEANTVHIQNMMRYLVDTKHISLLLAPHGDVLVLRIAEVARSLGALLVSPTTSRVSRSTGGPLFFTMMPNVRRTFVNAFKALASSGAKTFSVFRDDSLVMTESCSLEAIGSRFGVQLVNTTVLREGEAVEQKLKLYFADADAVFVCVLEAFCNDVRKAFENRQWNARAIFIRGCQPSDEAYAAGVVTAAVWDASLNDRSELGGWTTQEFNAAYQLAFPDQLPSEIAASAFATCETLVLAVERASSRDSSRVASALGFMNIASVYGTISFDQNMHQLDRDFYIVQFDVDAQPTILFEKATVQTNFSYPAPTWIAIRCVSQKREVDSYGASYSRVCGACGSGTFSKFDASKGHRVCGGCELGSATVSKPSGIECSACETGRFSTGNASFVSCQQCPPGTFQAERGQSHCDVCKFGTFTALFGSRECIRCDPTLFGGRRHMADMLGSVKCTLCPDKSICEESEDGLFKSITNEPGYVVYMTNETGVREFSSSFCKFGDGKACLSHGRCAESAEGPLCGFCRPGHGRESVDGLCTKCGSAIDEIGRIFWDLFILAFVVFVLSLVVLCGSPSCIIITKIFITYLNLVSAAWSIVPKLGFFDIQASQGLRTFDLLSGWTHSNTGSRFFACFASKHLRGIPMYRVHIALGILSIPLGVSFIYFGFVVFRCIQRRRGAQEPKIDTLVAVLSVFICLEQPLSINQLTHSLQSVHLGSNFVASDPNVIFREGDHDIWVWLATCHILLLAVVGPTLLGLFVKRLRKLDLMNSGTWGRRLAFVHIGYTPVNCWYESISMVRKAVVHLAATTPLVSYNDLSAARKVRSKVLFACIFIFYAIHGSRRPYDSRDYFMLERFESASLEAGLLTAGALIGVEWGEESYAGSRTGTGSQDTFVAVFVTALHLRVLFHALKASVFCFESVRLWIESRGAKVRIFSDCLSLESFSQSSRLLLEDMCGQVGETHMKYKFPIYYDSVGIALKRIAVQAAYLKVESAKRDYTFSPYFDMCCEWIDYFRPPKVIQDYVKPKILRAKDIYVTASRTISLLASDGVDQAKAYDGDAFSRFTAESFQRTFNGTYSVNDFYLAMLSLGNNLCQVGAPADPLRTGYTERSLSMTTGQLDDLEVYRSELRLVLAVNKALRKQLSAIQIHLDCTPEDGSVQDTCDDARETCPVASQDEPSQEVAADRSVQELRFGSVDDSLCSQQAATVANTQMNIEAASSRFWIHHKASDLCVVDEGHEVEMQVMCSDAEHAQSCHDVGVRVNSHNAGREFRAAIGDPCGDEASGSPAVEVAALADAVATTRSGASTHVVITDSDASFVPTTIFGRSSDCASVMPSVGASHFLVSALGSPSRLTAIRETES
eukprot:TRINITY_DN44074_c0_g1_i1.p1 TRINITY_DN44074_c0_g1~~TRINITY_DN44074_c0_g1_i1.p1  ORF type:complete len:1493 (+),score=174.22 TRINITY_DN44074_c0_g1_i1:416-4480(+)